MMKLFHIHYILYFVLCEENEEKKTLGDDIYFILFISFLSQNELSFQKLEKCAFFCKNVCSVILLFYQNIVTQS